MEKRISNRFKELLAIKERTERQSISQRQVAEDLGIAKTTIDRIARNETTRFDGRILLAICDYLDCTIGEFLFIEDETEGQEETLLATA